MKGNLVGLILSIAAAAIIAITFYWAVTRDETTTVTKYNEQTVDNRYQQDIAMTLETSTRWGTIPGDFGSTMLNTVNIQMFS